MVPPSRRIVAVTADLGDERFRYGSGCLVSGRWVLTAAHVVDGALAVSIVDPAKHEYSADVDPRFLGDVDGPAPDLALLRITDPDFDPMNDPLPVAAVDRQAITTDPVERVHAIGFPEFADVPIAGATIRESVDAIGFLPLASGLARGLLSLQVSVSPEPLPDRGTHLASSPWSGISGAPVLAGGHLLGVVTEHAPRAGPATITAVPLTALFANPDHPEWGEGVGNPTEWCRELGVGEQETWPRLPERPAHRTQPAYLDTLREIGRTLHARMPQLLNRNAEMADIASFATGSDAYGWLVGGAYAGKSALLYEAVTVGLPDEVDVVSYFLSRRASDASGERFLAAVVPQLAYLCDLEEPAPTRDEFLRLWRKAGERADHAGRHLLLAIDGLDEDQLSYGSPSVASLLPTLVGGALHVLVTSRPSPELPRDVPSRHPLFGVDPVRIRPFEGAEDLAYLARQEIESLIHGPDSDLAVDVFGTLTAAAGPLAVDDLTTLTSDLPQASTSHTRRVRRLLTEEAARSLEPVGQADDPRYQFAHLSLLEYAQTHRDLTDAGYLARIGDWAEHWRASGWPIGSDSRTPRYLFEAYPSALWQNPPELVRLVSDPEWICAAVQSLGVDRVLAELRVAASAAPADLGLAEVLVAVRGQAEHLRGSETESDFVEGQLCHQALQLGEEVLADALRRRLVASPTACAIPRWSTRRPEAPLIGEFNCHDGATRALRALSDGRFVTGGADGRVRIWDPAASARVPVEVGGHSGRVNSVAVLTDDRIVSGGDDGEVRLWDLLSTDGDAVVSANRLGSIQSMVALPAGRFVCGWNDGRIQMLDSGSLAGTPLTHAAHFGAVRALAELPDGSIVSGGNDGRIRMWPPPTSPQADPSEIGAHAAGISALVGLVNGQIVSGGDDGWVRLWTPSQTGSEGIELGRHRGRVLALSVLTDGRLVSSGDDDQLMLWNPFTPATSGAEVGKHPGVHALSVLSEGLIASGGADGTVRMWDPSTRSRRYDEPGSFPVTEPTVNNLGGHAPSVRRKTHRVRKSFTPSKSRFEDVTQSKVLALTVLPDGRAVTGDEDGRVRLWVNPTSSEAGIDLGTHRNSVGALSVLPDGRVISAGENEPIKLWELDSINEASLGHHIGRVTALVGLPNGRVVTGSEDGQVRISAIRNGPFGWTPLGSGHWGAILALGGLPDGRVISGSTDGRLRIWNPAGPNEGWADLGGHVGAVLAVAVLPGGLVVSGGADGHLRVWDPARPAAPLHDILDSPGPVLGVAALQHGRVAAAREGGARIWDVQNGRPCAELACQVSLLTAAVDSSGAGTLVAAHHRNGLSAWLVSSP